MEGETLTARQYEVLALIAKGDDFPWPGGFSDRALLAAHQCVKALNRKFPALRAEIVDYVYPEAVWMNGDADTAKELMETHKRPSPRRKKTMEDLLNRALQPLACQDCARLSADRERLRERLQEVMDGCPDCSHGVGCTALGHPEALAVLDDLRGEEG